MAVATKLTEWWINLQFALLLKFSWPLAAITHKKTPAEQGF